ncbi:MAG: sulfatase-like hydrolase/transferase [Bacteroidota bacterium]
MRIQYKKKMPGKIMVRTVCMTMMIICHFGTAQKTKKPNIIYIMTDQQSANAMSCTGNLELATPAMDGLAKDGILYEHAYCTFPICSPARASMMTGLMPHRTGNNANNVGIPDSILPNTLAHTLQRNGYETFYGGKWHLPSYTIKEGQGFEIITDFGDDDLAESAIDYIEKKHSRPFFMVLSFDNPHNICEFARNQPLPWGEVNVPNDSRELPNLPKNFGIPEFEPDIIRDYQAERPRVFPTFSYTPNDWRIYRHAYNRLVEKVDLEIQKIIEALKDNGYYEESLIIFSSDHGDGQGAHQWNQKTILYEESINVPLILKLPNSKHAGKQVSMPVSVGLDLFPTISEFTGIRAPKGLEGFNLLEWINDQDKERPPVFVETLMDVPEIIVNRKYYGYAILKGNLKYIGYSQGKHREQLFNLENDPGEMVNLAVESRYDDTLKEFRKLLLDWMVKTDAPGLRAYKYYN